MHSPPARPASGWLPSQRRPRQLRGSEGGNLRQAGSRPDQRALPLSQARNRPAGHDLEGVIKANAKVQAALLREASPVCAGLIKQKKLPAVAGYYDLASGAVTVL